MLTECFSQALYLALQAHTNQKRKSTDVPYIAHPFGVASIALEWERTVSTLPWQHVVMYRK